MTYTYSILEVSPALYAEVASKLREAGWERAFHNDGDGDVIDMHGIALRALRAAPSGEPRELLEKLETAHATVCALSRGDQRWRMTIPPRDDDPDILIGTALREAMKYIRAVDRVARPPEEPTAEQVAECCALVCESRSASLFHDSGRINESNEAGKCAAAIRSGWRRMLQHIPGVARPQAGGDAE